MKIDNNLVEISEKLKSLGNPSRLQIVIGLLKDRCSVSLIQKKLELPQSTISQHLSVLKNNKIIKGNREGTKVCYEIIDNKIIEIIKIIQK